MQTTKVGAGSASPSEVSSECCAVASEGGSLDKSGKPRQVPSITPSQARESMEKRARSKYLTMGVLKELVELNSPLNDQYKRAFSCCRVIEQVGGELTSHYCRCRWCVVCNRIRMAKRIDTYQPVFEEWEDVWFVTLTVPNCRASELSDRLDEMQHQLKLCRKQIRRTRELEYKAVRATEVTFNADKKTFHPHYHIAVQGEDQALALVIEWLKRWPDAVRSAQDVRPWGGGVKDLKELTKYCTKLVCTGVGEKRPPAWALDAIFRALEGRHLFRPIGFELPPEMPDPDSIENLDDLKATLPAYKRPGESVVWTWDALMATWVDQDTGEILCGYEPSAADRAAVEGRKVPRNEKTNPD